MFSIIHKTGTFIASDKNIETPFLASAKATACGVLTTTAPVIGNDCIIDKWISPVHGGKSINMKSNSPQFASKIILFKAFAAIGPLHITA